MPKKIFCKIGFTGIIVLLTVLILYAMAIFNKKSREANSVYIKGISLGLEKGVKGNLILAYEFIIDGKKYTGFVPGSFCNKCMQCCSRGDSVFVRYQLGNPENSNLVVELPANE